MNPEKNTMFELCFTVRTSVSEVRTPLRARTIEQAKEQADNYVTLRTTSYGVGIETSQGWQCQAWRTIHPTTGADKGWVNW